MNDIDHQEEEREITIHHQINALRDEADAMVRMDQSVKKAFILSTIKELESELIDDCNLAPEEQEIEDAPFYPSIPPLTEGEVAAYVREEVGDDAFLMRYADRIAPDESSATLTLPRDEAVRIYESALRECGWMRGRNHLQVCLSDCGFYSFDFERVNDYTTRVKIVDFTPDF